MNSAAGFYTRLTLRHLHVIAKRGGKQVPGKESYGNSEYTIEIFILP